MNIQTMKSWLEEHLQNVVYIPEDLEAHIHTVRMSPHDPWWLAEAIVISALEDSELEGEVLELMQIMEDSVQKNTFMNNLFDIVERVVNVMSQMFRAPALKNAFTKDNALVTIYYVVMFVFSCSLGEDRDTNEVLNVLKEYESIFLRLSQMTSKLMLNNDVYEFVTDNVESCLKAKRWLC